MNVWTKFHGKQLNSCLDISPKTTNVNLMASSSIGTMNVYIFFTSPSSSIFNAAGGYTKSQGIHPLGTKDTCTKFHGNHLTLTYVYWSGTKWWTNQLTNVAIPQAKILVSIMYTMYYTYCHSLFATELHMSFTFSPPKVSICAPTSGQWGHCHSNSRGESH